MTASWKEKNQTRLSVTDSQNNNGLFERPSLVMDKLQGDYAVEYEKTRKIINETRHPAEIRFARKK